jgi:hypothetical protein
MVPTITNPSFGEELYLPWQRRGAAIARKRLDLQIWSPTHPTTFASHR